MDKDGGKILETDKAALINLPCQTLWSQVDVTLQQQTINTVGTNHPYKALIDVLLNTTDSEKSCVLQGEGYYKDKVSGMDSADPAIGQNSGLYYRNLLTKNGKIADLEGVIRTDICQQERYLLDGVQVNFKLWHAKNAFRIISDNANSGIQVKLVDAYLRVCSIKVLPNVLIATSEVLKSRNAIYPFKRSVIKAFSLQQGKYSFNADDIYQGEVPISVCIGITSAEFYKGTYTKNPFNFKNYNCSYVSFNVDGQSVPARPFQLKYSSDCYVSAYVSLVDRQKYPTCSQKSGIGIERTDFPKGYCLYYFDLNKDTPITQTSVIKKGHTSLEMRFDSAIPENCTVILYALFPGIVEIDSSRNVIVR